MFYQSKILEQTVNIRLFLVYDFINEHTWKM